MGSEVIMVYKGKTSSLITFPFLFKSHIPTLRSKEDFLILANQNLQIFKSLSTDQADPQDEKPRYGNISEQTTGEVEGLGERA